MGRDEVLEDRQSLAERRGDRALDDVAVRRGHESAHAGELADLQLRAAGLRVDEHVDRVQLGRVLVLGADVLVDRLVELVADLLGRRGPDVDDLVVALAVGDDALLELLLDLVGGLARLRDLGVLLGRADHVLEAHRRAGDRREAVAERLEAVDREHGLVMPRHLVAVEDEVADRGLGALVVPEAHLLRPHVVEDHAASGRLDHALRGVAVGTPDGAEVGVPEADPGVVGDRALGDAELDFRDVVEERQVLLAGRELARDLSGELVLLRGDREEVEPEADVLRRRHDGLSARRREDRRGGEHHELRLHLRLDRERDVHGHLVAVEVRVERRADHRVEADRLALDEHRLERLDRQAVQRRRAVEEHGLVLRDLLEDRPDLVVVALDHLARGADRVADAALLEDADDERLEQAERHLLRDAALRELEVGSDADHGAAGVVDALAEEVLAEASRLALEHLGKGLERAVAGARHGAPVAAVVEHRVDCLLEHALLVADDDVRRLEREQVPEAVVAVDDAAVEVVEVARREAAALERDERAQLRRDDGQHVQHHPLGLGVGGAEALDHLHALGDLLAVLLGAGVLHLLLEVLHEVVEVELLEELPHRLCAHLGLEAVGVLLERVLVLLVGEDLPLLEAGVARLDDHPVLVVEHPLELARRLVEEQAHPGRGALEEPDVAHGDRELDVAHALAADRRERHLDAAAVADHALVLDALVLAAGAFPVLSRTEDLLAEEPVLLGAVRAVVDRLGVLDLAVRPAADRLGGGELHLDGVVVGGRVERAAEYV